MAKATTDGGATITTSNNNNEKQQQQKQQRAAGTKYNVFVLKATTAKTLLPVCECVCVRTTDTIRAQLSALMSEAMETVVMYVCVCVCLLPTLCAIPPCVSLSFFLRQKAAASRNHNDKNHASRHSITHTHTHTSTHTDRDTMYLTKMRIIFVWWLSESLQLNKK